MRFGGIWGRAVVAVAVVALVIVGACSDPEPKEPSVPASSATPTASPPTMPAQAQENTPEGAAAFVNYYTALFNHAVNTGDSASLDRLFEDSCEGCRSYSDQVRASHLDGTQVRGFRWSAQDGTVEDGNVVEVIVTAAEYQTRSGPDVAWSNVESAKYKIGFDLKYADEWRIKELFLPKGAR